MSIARSIQILAAARGNNEPRGTLVHANALAEGQPEVNRAHISVDAAAIIHEYKDGSFLAIGTMALPFVAALDSATTRLTMAQAYEVFADAIAEIAAAGVELRDLTARASDDERPQVPTGSVPRVGGFAFAPAATRPNCKGSGRLCLQPRCDHCFPMGF